MDDRKSETDYINATHIDVSIGCVHCIVQCVYYFKLPLQSLLKPNAYIVSQGPNETTLEDFWCMIWQENIRVIVMLTKVYEFIRVMCTQYWPTNCNEPEIIGEQFEVTLVDEDKLADYIVRTLKVRLVNSNTVNEVCFKDSKFYFEV